MERIRIARNGAGGGSYNGNGSEPSPAGPSPNGKPPQVRKKRGGPRYGNPNGTRGGWRGKGGRPKGSANKLSQWQREQAAKLGELPHEFMARLVRLGPGAKIGDHILDWDDIKWAAAHAAPYYGARLTAVQIKGDGRPSITIALDPDKLRGMSSDELTAMLSALIALNGGGNIINGTTNMLPAPEEPGADLYEQTLQ